MIFYYFTFSVSICFISWLVGMICNSILMKTKYYKRLDSLVLIKSKSVNKRIGLSAFKWIVKNTPFKFFNQKLKIERKPEISTLKDLRKEMTFSEISHFIGFAFVSVFAIIKVANAHFLFALIIMIINTLMNLYPSLLQQENKVRIDRFIKLIEKR